MNRVFIIGVGMTKFDKPGEKTGDYYDWAKEAIIKALTDAKITMNEVEQATAGCVYGDSTSGQRAIYEVGMKGIPIYNVNNNCATGSTALLLAKQFIEGGMSDCILTVGFENMGSVILHQTKYSNRTYPLDKHVNLIYEVTGKLQLPLTPYIFGNLALEHMAKYGTKEEHFAKIAYKNHKHSVNNPYAQFRKEYTLEEIMNSKKLCGPLTKLQCCANGDGAGAAILASEKFVRAHGLESQAVEILAMEMSTDVESTFNDGSIIKIAGFDLTKAAAERAYAKSGVRPGDIQVMEIHDCFSSSELIAYEALGLCPMGKAGEFVDKGDNTYGGKHVINPSGGLICKGHPLGATGLAQCAELCWQLRGLAGARQVPGAKLALQQNFGLGGAAVVAIYKLGFSELQNGKSESVKGDTEFISKL